MNNKETLPSTTGAWVLMALSVLYFISPVDIIPDVPVVGQIDDLIIAATGSLNLLQKYLERWDSEFSTVVKIIKWILIFIGIIVIAILALAAAAIIKLFQ